MRLAIFTMDKINAHLCDVSRIVDLQQDRSQRFPYEVLGWLSDTEKILTEAGLSASSEVAGLRSRLVATLNGGNQSEGLSRRRAGEAMASSVLEAAQRHVTQVLAPQAQRLREAEELALQLAAASRAKGMLAAVDTSKPHDEALRQLLSMLLHDSDTAAGTVHLQGLIGVFDALVVLDRVLPELNST